MTATEELRRLLDERGVEWELFDGEPTWTDGDGKMYYARHEFTFAGPTDEVTVFHLTPEQAVEATLGPGTCEYEFVTSIGGGILNACGLRCSYCGREQMGLEPPNYCPNCGRMVVE